jgi:hypothetical protein
VAAATAWGDGRQCWGSAFARAGEGAACGRPAGPEENLGASHGCTCATDPAGRSAVSAIQRSPLPTRVAFASGRLCTYTTASSVESVTMDLVMRPAKTPAAPIRTSTSAPPVQRSQRASCSLANARPQSAFIHCPPLARQQPAALGPLDDRGNSLECGSVRLTEDPDCVQARVAEAVLRRRAAARAAWHPPVDVLCRARIDAGGRARCSHASRVRSADGGCRASCIDRACHRRSAPPRPRGESPAKPPSSRLFIGRLRCFRPLPITWSHEQAFKYAHSGVLRFFQSSTRASQRGYSCPMATVEITHDTLVVHVTGIDRVLAFKSTITVPLDHVAVIDQDLDEASVVFHGLKLPGTGIPGVVTAGSFLRHGEWTFWDVHDPAKAVVIRLHDEHYRRLVVGVENPEEAIERTRAALSARRAT